MQESPIVVCPTGPSRSHESLSGGGRRRWACSVPPTAVFGNALALGVYTETGGSLSLTDHQVALITAAASRKPEPKILDEVCRPAPPRRCHAPPPIDRARLAWDTLRPAVRRPAPPHTPPPGDSQSPESRFHSVLVRFAEQRRSRCKAQPVGAAARRCLLSLCDHSGRSS